MKVVMIAAIDADNAIAKNGEIPWNIPEDVEFFKQVTNGHELIMGRVTYEADGPLPGRDHIVLTSQDKIEGAKVASDPDEALELVEDDVVYICGGQGVYESFIHKADEMFISMIPGGHNGDRFFPEIDSDQWEIVAIDERDDFEICKYERRD